MGINELDRPLNFHGNSEITPQTYGSRNTATIGVDEVAYQAANGYENNAGTGNPNFGSSGSKYSKAVRKLLHHETEFAPCKRIDGKDYENGH